MRLYSYSGGVFVMAVVGLLASGVLFIQAGTAQAGTGSTSARADTSTYMLRLMNQLHSDQLVDHADLPADPSKEFVVVDLRSAADFARDHLPGAVNLQPELLLTHLGVHATDPNRAILLYGYSDYQSLQSVMALRLFAYKNVLHLRGGWPTVPEFPSDKLGAM